MKTWADVKDRSDLKDMIHAKWPLLTSTDPIDTQEHLIASVKLRYALTLPEAQKEVSDWLDQMNWADASRTWESIQGPDFKTTVKSRWNKLTDDDIVDISTQDKLAFAVSQRYAMKPQDAIKEVGDWVAGKNYVPKPRVAKHKWTEATTPKADIKKRWPILTDDAISRCDSEDHLAAEVAEAYGISKSDATDQVDAWMYGE